MFSERQRKLDIAGRPKGRLFALTAVVATMMAVGSPVRGQSAETEGLVVARGAAAAARVFMKSHDDSSETPLCADAEGKRLRRLSGFQVRVSGAWTAMPSPEERCLAVSSFKVRKAPDGRDVIAGVLRKQGRNLVLEAEDGSNVVLRAYTVGLEYRVGTKVLMTLRQVSDPRVGEPIHQVIYYAPYP